MRGRPGFINNKMLWQIARNTDWQRLVTVLGLTVDERKTKPHDIWALSPFTQETQASFHIRHNGTSAVWKCFSTGKAGGVVELVQEVLALQGEKLNCYEAGRWLLDQGLSHQDTPTTDNVKVQTQNLPTENQEKKEKRNQPTKFNLMPFTSQQGEHPEFVRRGISRATCEHIRCGYLAKGNGAIAGRIVFQIRGVQKDDSTGELKSVILSHLGRATTTEQEQQHGKWWHYADFSKSLELFGLDRLLLHPEAVKQAQETGQVILVEGCFDVAKLVEAGTYNVVATFGARLYESQLPKLKLISEHLGVNHFMVWFDRDKAGIEGQAAALSLLTETGYQATGFDWGVRFGSAISKKDACDFSVDELRQLQTSFVGR